VGLFVAATAAVPKLTVSIEAAKSNVKSRLATGLLSGANSQIHPPHPRIGGN